MPSTPTPTPTNPTPTTTPSSNQQKLKLYISLSQQPIPDIINDNSQNIFSHFKFFFNDTQLTMTKLINNQYVSILHAEEFQRQIKDVYKMWKIKQDCQREGKKMGMGMGVGEIKFSNFVAFVEQWVRGCVDLVVNYTVYDEMVSECVISMLENTIYSLTFKLGSPSKPFNLKSSSKPNKQLHSVHSSPKNSSPSQQIQKRLQTYFTHFSKLKNLSLHSSNPLYCNNGSKTFDEIEKLSNTLNLQQWISFVRAFKFDRIYEDVVKDRKSGDAGREGKGVEVRNVKWNTSLQFFKNLFEKFCDNTKNLNLAAFHNIIKKLFQQVFPQQQSPATTPQQQGIEHLKLLNEQQFNNQLRSLGVFVPICPTIIPTNANMKKSYEKTKPKYLNLPTAPLMSSQKIKRGKDQNKNIVLPSLNLSMNKKVEKQKVYTLSELMGKNQGRKYSKTMNYSIRQQSKSMLVPQLTISKNNNLKKLENIISQKTEKGEKSSFLRSIVQQYEAEPDQFLSKFENRSTHKENKASQKNNASNSKGYRSGHEMYARSAASVMRVFDERAQKMQNKIR